MDKWIKFSAAKFDIAVKETSRMTDKKYARDLRIMCTDARWRVFYQAIHALERGCGYSESREFGSLCRACVREDDLRVLRMIEEKSHLIDVVLCLRAVEYHIRLKWLRENAFHSSHVLFECLRQELQNERLSAEDQDAWVNGMCCLTESSPEHAQYLLKQFRFHQKDQEIMAKLLAQLSEKGWRVFANSVSFSNATSKEKQFWDLCRAELNWNEIHVRATPLLDAWSAYLQDCIETGKFQDDLYNGFSNYLISILHFRLSAMESFEKAYKDAIICCETAMQRWHENVVRQHYSFLAGFSQIALLSYVWRGHKDTYATIFPQKLRQPTLMLLQNYRYLWDDCMYKVSLQQIQEVKEWLEQLHI